MVKIEKNKEYEVHAFREGITGNGNKWQIINVVDGKGNFNTTLFVSNIGQPLTVGQHFRVKDIVDFVHKSKPDGKGGWYDNSGLTVVIEPLIGINEPGVLDGLSNGFSDLADVSGDLPFDTDDPVLNGELPL